MKTLGILVGLGLLVGISGVASAFPGSGFSYYAVEVPEGVTIGVDGDLSDWSWFPAAAEITTADMYPHVCEGADCEVRPDDWDMLLRVAWSGDTNKLYVSAKVYDDIWDLAPLEDQTELYSWDNLELLVDADNSGGPIGSAADPKGSTGQQILFAYTVPGLQFSYYGAKAIGTWFRDPEYTEFAAVLDGNTMYYEVALTLFDYLGPTFGESTVHNLTLGEAIGFGVLYDEHDDTVPHEGYTGYAAQWKTHEGQASYGNADEVPDFVLIAAPVAVEQSWWGEIKALFRW